MEFTNSLMIRATKDTVFKYLRDMENYPKWNYAVSRIIEDPEYTSTYTLYRDQMGPPMEKVKVLEVEKDKSISMEVSGGWFPYTISYHIVQSDDKIYLENKVQITAHGINKMLIGIFINNLKTAVRRNLDVLKGNLEKNEFLPKGVLTNKW